MVPYADIDIHGVEHIPATGPAIIVANHRSYFDPTVMAMVLAKAGRTVRFLGKKEVFDVPVLGAIAKAMGGIRVDRGTGSDEPLKAAAEALQGGEVVALMPQGTIPRGEAFFDPELTGRLGAARLAQLTGAPVIPVGLWGTEKVWPRSSRMPRLLNIVDAPTVTARVGKPAEPKHKSLEADTKRIMKAIVKQLPPRPSGARRPPRSWPPPTHPAVAELTGASARSVAGLAVDGSRMRSAWPQWRAYSSIMWTRIHRSDHGCSRYRTVASGSCASAIAARLRSIDARYKRWSSVGLSPAAESRSQSGVACQSTPDHGSMRPSPSQHSRNQPCSTRPCA